MADLEFGVAVPGVEQALADLKKISDAQKAANAAGQAAGNQAANAARGASQALTGAANASQTFAQGVSQSAQRVQGAASSIAALSGALGGGTAGRGAGLISAFAGAAAQAAQLGATLGPAGIVIGGLTALVPIISMVVGAQTAAADAARAHSEELRRVGVDAQDAAARLREYRSAAARIGRAGDALGRQDAEAALQRALAGTPSDLQEARRAQPLLEERRTEIQRMQHAPREWVEEQERQIDDAIGLARTAQARFEAEAARQRTGRGGAGGDPLAENLDALAEREQRFRIAQEAALQARVDGELRVKAIEDAIREEREAAEQRVFEAGKARQEDQVRQQEEHFREADAMQDRLAHAAGEAQAAFAEGWTSSIDEVVKAWRDANVALAAADRTMLSNSRLLERGMVAIGNNIAETVGGKMQGAFEGAVQAWVSGSKTFIEAAEEMAKGVIQSLVVESIVQAVVEFARGVAAIAGQDYVGAPLHFIAAAEWAAVGAVAGAVGAGIGAFGGGGGGKGGAAADAGGSKDLSSRSLSDGDRAQGPTNIYIYPGQVFAREQDVFNAVVAGVNAGIRDGRRIDPRGLRGSGRG